MKKTDYKFDYLEQKFKRCSPSKKEKQLAALMVIFIFAVVIALGLFVFTCKSQGQSKKQNKVKSDTTILIDSTKYIKYFVVKNDTVKKQKLTKMEQHNIRMSKLIRRKIK